MRQARTWAASYRTAARILKEGHLDDSGKIRPSKLAEIMFAEAEICSCSVPLELMTFLGAIEDAEYKMEQAKEMDGLASRDLRTTGNAHLAVATVVEERYLERPMN